MGHLCREFERMRSQLQENNRTLWKNLEEERALRAAIAHDIRSPLSVLEGYQEMLLTYLPDGTIDTGKAMEMLYESRKQIRRMDAFVETMRKMNSLESRELRGRLIPPEELEADIRAELDILAPSGEKEAVLEGNPAAPAFFGDREVILEVAENLLSNALRYAKRKVEIRILGDAGELRIRVRDDGSGFQEDSETVTRAFHQKNIRDSLNHAGLGMYISRLYCEKHGGKLLLENDREGGAVITAVFRSIKKL